MQTLEIPVKNIRIEYPGEWDELTREQAIFAGRLLYLVSKRKLDVDQFRKLMIDKLIHRVNNVAKKLNDNQELDLWGNEWLLAETMNFFFSITKGEIDKQNNSNKRYRVGKVKQVKKEDKNEETGDKQAEKDGHGDNNVGKGKEAVAEKWEIMPTGTKNTIPGFRKRNIWRTKLYGPGDFLHDMTFAEYKDALAASMKYMETSEDVWLDRLTAILYRKKRPHLKKAMVAPDFDGKTRIVYNAGRVEKDMRAMKRVPIGIKYMALMYMMGCLWNLKNNAGGIEVDGNRIDFSILFAGRKHSDETSESGLGMVGIMMALAESGVFGTIKDVANADVWDVLVRMYQLEADRREFDRKMESNKK